MPPTRVPVPGDGRGTLAIVPSRFQHPLGRAAALPWALQHWAGVKYVVTLLCWVPLRQYAPTERDSAILETIDDVLRKPDRDFLHLEFDLDAVGALCDPYYLCRVGGVVKDKSTTGIANRVVKQIQ